MQNGENLDRGPSLGAMSLPHMQIAPRVPPIPKFGAIRTPKSGAKTGEPAVSDARPFRPDHGAPNRTSMVGCGPEATRSPPPRDGDRGAIGACGHGDGMPRSLRPVVSSTSGPSRRSAVQAAAASFPFARIVSANVSRLV